MNTVNTGYPLQADGKGKRDHSVFQTKDKDQLQRAFLSKIRIIVCLLFGVFLLSWKVAAQTDFAPGEIMFTGFKSDDADAFSIVLLADVVSGTVIYITDRGWSNTAGYRVDATAEGTISFTFNANYTCGTEIFFNDVGGTNDWLATNSYGVTIGTIAIQAGGDVDGMELGINGGNSTGDQLSIYQLPTPTSGNQGSFVCMIQMDNNLFLPVDSDDESELPTGLAADDIVRFNSEYDNVKYDCTPYVGAAATLRAAISNDNGAGGLKTDGSNNWAETDANTIILGPCWFCCGTTPPAPAPSLSAPFAVNTNQVFTISITGTLSSGSSWQLFTAGCGVGTPLQTTMTSSFTVTAPGTEGIVTYYVRTSQQVDCGGICGTVQVSVCNNINNMNPCTTCGADPTQCGDCFLPYPVNNPDLDSGCYAIRLIFVLDESGSIGNNAPQVEDGVLAFLNALNGQDIQMALIEFSNEARVVTQYTAINNSLIISMQGYFNSVPFNGQTYNPFNPGGSGAGTNWHDAMIKADAIPISSDILMFFTDGMPTGWNTSWNDCGNGGTTQTPEIVNPVKIANKLKGEDTHMFMLGVGNGVDQNNLELMSGYTQYSNGNNTIGTSDFSIGNFQDLADDLAAFVEELCRTPLEFDKQVVGSVCNGVQQFRFILHNPGTESAATVVQVIDTFPSGFNNIVYLGDPHVKLCIGSGCDAQGQHQPPTGFVWTTNSVPPGGSDTLDLYVNVLPTGNYTNVGWAQGSNTDLISDTTTSSNLSDDLAPTIMCPTNVTISCTEVTLASNTGMPTANDPDGAPPTISHTDVTVAGGCPQEYIITRRWTATDGCLNTATCNQIIAIDDNAAPQMTCPANVTLNCTANTLPANTGTATATDNCSTLTIISTDVVTGGSCPQESTIRRTWRATDACGNSSTCLQTIIVDDADPPAITCPANVTVQCYANTLPGVTGNATATDVCDATPIVNYSDMTIQGPTPHGYSILRTWSGADDCGNSNTCLQNIIVENPLDPGITGAAFDTLCSGGTVMFQAMNQGLGPVTYQWTFGSGASPPSATGIGPHTVMYTYNGTNGTVGAYVLLTVSLSGCASVTDTVANVHVNPIPNPAIDAPTSNLCYYVNRSFKPVAAQIPGYTYNWDFGNGANVPPTSGYGPHLVKYTTIGTKTVQLIVNSNAPGSSCSDTATISFTVIACPGSITGRVRKVDGTGIGSVHLTLFADENLDGLPDGAPIQGSNTLSTGVYNLLTIVPGQYTIVESQPGGYTSVSEMDETNDFDTIVYDSPNDNILPVTIEPNEIDRDNVFVESPSPGIISGYVFQDLNSNLVPESGEGIFAATINLYTDTDLNGVPDVGGFVTSKTTSAIGYFEFGSVSPGNFVLWETQPPGYSNQNDVDVTNDSDNVPNTNTTNDIIPVTIVFGETDAENYFTENQTCGQVVTNTNDSGPGSLRYVINCSANNDVITFHPFLANQTIHLSSGRLVFDKNLTIHSDLTPRVKIQSDIVGAFLINAGYTVEFQNIDVTSGLSGNFGAAFENYGNLTLWDMNIFRNNLLLPGSYLIYNSTTGLLTVKGGIQIDGN